MKKFYTIFGIIFFLYIVGSTSESTIDNNTNVQEPARTVTKPKDKPVPEPISEKVLYVSGSVVNLRSKATTNSRIVTKLTRGTKVHTNGQRDGKWIPISVDNSNVTGWMHGDFLKETKPKIAVTPKQVTKRKRSVSLPTTKEIRAAQKQIIRQSINSYQGSCPCPYNRDRAGRRCGGRSAWSRPGGYSPICFAEDISQARLKTYFKRAKGITY